MLVNGSALVNFDARDQAHVFAVLESQGPVAFELYFVEQLPSGSFSTGSAFIGSMKEKLLETVGFAARESSTAGPRNWNQLVSVFSRGVERQKTRKQRVSYNFLVGWISP